MGALAILIVVLLVWIGLLWLFYKWGAGIAERKGRTRAMGWIAVFFGFIGILVLYLMSDESVPAYIQHSPASTPRVSGDLEKLARLKEKGVLTEEEFEQRKRALLR